MSSGLNDKVAGINQETDSLQPGSKQGLQGNGSSGLQGIGNTAAQTDTRTETGKSTNQSHAKGGGDASIVPQVLQEKLPESVERAVPNALHDTGDQDGLHRKQA